MKWKLFIARFARRTGRDWLYAGRLERILIRGFDATHWHSASLLGAPAAFRLGTGPRLMTLHEYWLICTKRTCYSCAVNRGRPLQFWRRNGVITNGLENISLIYPRKCCRTFCRLRRCRQGSERITT